MNKNNKILLGVIVVIVCIIFYMNTKTTKEGFEENTIEKPIIEKIYLKEDTPITWSYLNFLAEDENKNRIGRLPTQQEFEDAGINDGKIDMWMPASRTDGKLNEWIQTGTGYPHYKLYKSHIDFHGPPKWGLNVLKWSHRPYYGNTINYIYVIYELSEAEAARLKAAEEARIAAAEEAARLKAAVEAAR